MVLVNNQTSGLGGETEQRSILKVSRGAAIVLMFGEFDLFYSQSGILMRFRI